MMAPGFTGIIGLLPNSPTGQNGRGAAGLGRLKKSREKRVNCYSLEPTKTQKVVIEGQLQKVHVYITFICLASRQYVLCRAVDFK